MIIVKENREVVIPLEEVTFGVESDQGAEIKEIQIPRRTDSGVDLAAASIKINYINGGGQVDMYAVLPADITAAADTLTIKWRLSRNVTRYKGKVAFVVCCRITSSGTVTAEWNSAIGYGVSREGIEAEASLTEPQIVDAIASAISRIDAEAARVIGTIPPDYSGLVGEVDSLKEDLAETDSRLSESITEISDLIISKSEDDLEWFQYNANIIREDLFISDNVKNITCDDGFYLRLYAYENNSERGMWRKDHFGTSGNYNYETDLNMVWFRNNYPEYRFKIGLAKIDGTGAVLGDESHIYVNAVSFADNNEFRAIEKLANENRDEIDALKSFIGTDNAYICSLDGSIGDFKFVSVAQADDDGNNIGANVPVYSNFGYQGKKGIRYLDANTKQALFLDVREKVFSKYGIGVLFRTRIDSSDYDANGLYILHGYKDAQNYIELKYRPTLHRFVLSITSNGVTNATSIQAPWNDALDFKKGDLMGIYLHFVSDRVVNIYLMFGGSVSINTIFVNNLPVVSLNSLALGVRYRGSVDAPTLGSNATYQSNCVFSNFKMEFGDNIRPIKYFEEVM